jgi:sulfur carrier protein ThiS
MKITVECLGLPNLAALIGQKMEIDVEDGMSLSDLVQQITGRFGAKALLDAGGGLESTVQVMVNEDGIIDRGNMPKWHLRDGDRVRFMLLVGGG